MSGHAIRGHPVWAKRQPGGHIGHAHAMGPQIGALIVKKFVVDGKNVPVGIDSGTHLMTLLAGMVCG